jgi:hypothetical protein
LRQPKRLGALLPFDSGENAINTNARILKISKQISDRYPFTINSDQTEIHFTLNQNTMNSKRHRLELFMKYAAALDLINAFTSDWLNELFPGTSRIVGCTQGVENHSEGDVAIHTAMVFENLLQVCRCDLGREADFIERLAAIIHDWKKPDSRIEDENGSIAFPGHEELANSELSMVGNTLELNALELSKLRFLVAEHGNAHGFENLSPEKQISLRGDANIESLCAFQKADAMSCHCIDGGHLPVKWNLIFPDCTLRQNITDQSTI